MIITIKDKTSADEEIAIVKAKTRWQAILELARKGYSIRKSDFEGPE